MKIDIKTTQPLLKLDIKTSGKFADIGIEILLLS